LVKLDSENSNNALESPPPFFLLIIKGPSQTWPVFYQSKGNFKILVLTFLILIFFSITTGSNWTKLRCNIHWNVLFQNVSGDLVRHPRWLPWLSISWKILDTYPPTQLSIVYKTFLIIVEIDVIYVLKIYCFFCSLSIHIAIVCSGQW
jgi:hypothetical protein